MQEHDMPEIEGLDTYAAAFEFTPMVGLTIRYDTAKTDAWLSWDETVELAAWLAARVAEANTR